MEFGPCSTTDDVVPSMDRCAATIAAASAELLGLVARFDASKLWLQDGATSMTSWLSARYRLSWGSAREWVRVARALPRLPRIFEAFRAGRLSWDQLRPLSRFATEATDEAWARVAPGLRPAALYREAARHERMRRREVEQAHRLRYLRTWWDPERPVLYLEGLLPAEQGAAVERALKRRAEGVVLADDPLSPGEARLADALVEAVTGPSGKAAPAPVVVVHAGAEVLAGEESPAGPWLAETESGTRLCSETVRRLACDARIEWVLRSSGRTVGIGRRGRVVPSHLHRVLRYRDGGCRFPGCGRTSWSQAHHIVHWGSGGRTDLENLILLCSAHHRLIHEGGWRITGHPDEDLRFHDPTGRTLRPAEPIRAGPPLEHAV